jgi:phosphonate transport system substrate-binding protein
VTDRRELRLLSYLSPGFPHALYEGLARRLAAALDTRCSVRFEEARSGPAPGEATPLDRGEADIAFLCAPSYVEQRHRHPPAVGLVPVAPLFRDPRLLGRPRLFSDVIVARDGAARSFEDLRGGVWAYNDPGSLSGYYCVMQELAARGESERFFTELVPSGGHLRSLRQVAAREVDAAAIDSNVLALALRREPGLARAVRVLTSWGPFPVQPIVASPRMDTSVVGAIAGVLANLHEREAAWLAEFGLERFTPVAPADYDDEERALQLAQRVCGPSIAVRSR